MLDISIMNVVYTVINLLILYFIFKKFLFGRIDKILREREEAEEKKQVEAKETLAGAEALKSKYEQTVSMIDAERVRVLQEARDKGRSEYEEIVANAHKEAEQILDEARAEAKREVDRERADIEAEMEDLVLRAAERISAGVHSTAFDSALYDRFIAEGNNDGAVKESATS